MIDLGLDASGRQSHCNPVWPWKQKLSLPKNTYRQPRIDKDDGGRVFWFSIEGVAAELKVI